MVTSYKTEAITHPIDTKNPSKKYVMRMTIMQTKESRTTNRKGGCTMCCEGRVIGPIAKRNSDGTAINTKSNIR
jgi:hypothetical protein